MTPARANVTASSAFAERTLMPQGALKRPLLPMNARGVRR
jgi:hypothetical protein